MGLPACVIASGRQRAWLDETVGMEDSQKHAAVETNPLQVIATWSDCYIFEFLRILISFFFGEEVCVCGSMAMQALCITRIGVIVWSCLQMQQ